MYCSREYQLTSRFNQQYEKSTSNITDILVFGSTQQEHDSNVITFLERCLEVHLKLNLSKIKLNCFGVPFFGQCITAEGIKPDPQKVKAIKDWPIPSNVRELQSFLGMVNYLSHFVPELSSLRTSLQPLVKTNTDFIWLKSHIEAFERIKNAISNDCLLQFYDVSCPLLIECDASKKGLGCILLQPMDKNITHQDISDFSEKEIEEFLKHLRPVAYSNNHFQMLRCDIQTLKENFLA